MYVYIYLWIYILEISAFILGLAAVKRSSPLSYHVLVWLALATALVMTSSIVIIHYYHRNHWLYNLWYPVECSCLLFAFYRATAHAVIRRINRVLLWLLPAGMIITFGVHPDLFTFNAYGAICYLFLELISAFAFLADGLLRSEDHRVFREPLSWMAAGLIMHCFISILAFGMWIFMLKWPPKYYGVVMVLANTFYFAGMQLTFILLRKTNRPMAVKSIL